MDLFTCPVLLYIFGHSVLVKIQKLFVSVSTVRKSSWTVRCLELACTVSSVLTVNRSKRSWLMSWCCAVLQAALLASTPAAACRVPAVGVGGRTQLQPSQASRAAADKLWYWNLRGAWPLREGGHKFSSPVCWSQRNPCVELRAHNS